MRSIITKIIRIFKKSPEPTKSEAPRVEPAPINIQTENNSEMKPDRLQLALKITGKFEGSGFDNVTDDFDGQGISCGVLQWCIGQGSLQEKILKPYLERYGSIDSLGIFPDKIDHLAKHSIGTGLAIVRSNMLNGRRLKPEWREAWRKFMTRPAVIELQSEAAKSVADKADALMRSWKLDSDIAFCWFFDLVTQNGSLKGVGPRVHYDLGLIEGMIQKAPKKCSEMWMKQYQAKGMTKEQMILFFASYDRASLARSEYFQDVFSRKGSIALGCGFVHGTEFRFE